MFVGLSTVGIFFHYNSTLCNHIPNKMHFDINMFGTIVEHFIFSQMYDTLAITIQNNQLLLPLSQIASFIAFVAVMYFALVVDKATIDCKVAFQLIILLHEVNMYPIKDFLLSKFPT